MRFGTDDVDMNCLLCKYREQIIGHEHAVGAPQEGHHHHVEGIGTDGHHHHHGDERQADQGACASGPATTAAE